MSYRNDIERDMDQIGFGREMPRQKKLAEHRTFPAVDGINETLENIARRLEQSNVMLSDVADRLVGPIPEPDGKAAACFGDTLADRVRMIEHAAWCYETLLARF